MIELTLLGLHAVRSSDGRELDSLPAQPKRFALLAYLAISGGGGFHRRDSLAAMFWPEMDQFAARRALRNTLYHLREALGDGVIIARGNDAVSIDPALLTCDVTRLGEAVDAGRYEDAVDCYRGELLAGVHVPAAGEAFEEWLALERKRVTALVRRALLALSEREDQADNVSAAAYWAQRACALAPDDEGLLRRAMSLLAAASDMGGALRLYESYARHAAAEFGAKPSAETEALAARIRSGEQKARALREPSAVIAPTSAASDAVPERDQAPAPRSRRARRITLWATTAAAAVVVGVVAVRSMRAAHAEKRAAPIRVLVAVFENRTDDSDLLPLGRMTQDWLTQGILSSHLAEVVDPRAVFVQGRAAPGAAVDPITLAHRTGAGMVVSGNYYRTGDTLLFQANVMDVKTGRIVRAVGPIRSRVGAPVAALDELRSRVMTALATVVDARATQGLETVELPPFDVYRDYVDAWDVYWHGDLPRAQALFLRAAHRDSAFTPAALGATTVAANSNNCPLVDSLTHAINARSPTLARTDRLSLAIADARCHGRNEEMLRLTLERADLEPHDASAQMSAAAAALWANRPHRALDVLDRVDPAVDLGWMSDTTHFAYWGSVTEALHMLGRHREELDVADRVPPGTPLGRVWLRGSALAALSRPTAALALIDSSLSLPVETAIDIGLAPFTDGRAQYTVTPAWVANWISRELAVHGDTVAARQAATRAVAWYRNRPADERSTMEERFTFSGSLEMVGAYAEADQIMRQLATEDSTNVDFRGELAGLAAERGDTARADSLDRWLTAQPVARVSWTGSVYRARVAALLGRSNDAVARTRDALDEGAWPRWFHQEPAIMSLSSRKDLAALLAPKN
jgi:DNA-binding SARP family transcriptional activator/TolB-like protein